MPYDEKQFLLGIGAFIVEKYGHERRFIYKHQFSPMDLELVKYVPDLERESENVAIKKYLYEWFREACVRGHLDIQGSDIYLLNVSGLDRIQFYKFPVRYFMKQHWKWVVTASIGFVGMILAILRLTSC